MPIYALLDTERGAIEVRWEKPSRPANPSPTKRWIDDTPPVHDPATEMLVETSSIPTNATEVPYSIVARPPPESRKVIEYVAFQDRFTATEMDNVTKFVDAVDLTTGDPKRPRLKQALGRAWANNKIDLLDTKTVAFMDALVAGGVVTAQRKAEILTP